MPFWGVGKCTRGDRYVLIDLDHSGRRMTVHEAVENLIPLTS